MMRKFAEKLWKAIDIGPLIFFRIAFGLLMLWEMWRYLNNGWVRRFFIEPSFFFHYWGFEWVKPLAGEGMIWFFYALGQLAIFIVLGFFYRLTMLLFCLGISTIFLLDQSNYLNHFYLICLLSFLMIFVPAHRKFSLDVFFRPSLRSNTAPAWALWLLRGQMGLVYFFGGIAKLNADWLRAEPISTWLEARSHFPLFGVWFHEPWVGYFFAYGGLLFDLLIVPMLLYKHSRVAALLLAFAFHCMNGMLFNIGIFPFLAMAATLIFLPAHFFRWPRKPITAEKVSPRYGLLGFFALYFAIQLFLPLRHFLYSGDVSWTEEGHSLAWHMKLRSKLGITVLYAVDPLTGESLEIPIDEYLAGRQNAQMQDNPQMLLRFAHYLAEGDYQGMEIRAWSIMALNQRAPQLMIDPFMDLAAVPDDLWADDWILPLAQGHPHERAVPTLLLSRRVDGVLALVNASLTSVELDGLRLDFGEAGFSPVGTLLPANCLLLYNGEPPSSICPMETHHYLGHDFPDFELYLHEAHLVSCHSLSCLVVKP
jgi:vitamin K-dependent gamma-carboxylase